MSTRRRIIPPGSWLRDVARVLDEVKAQGRVPILVGGTGLYFKALTTGLAAVPPIPADIRAQVRARLQSEGAPALHAELARLDPATAQRAHAATTARASRARWKWSLATGRPLRDWHREGLPPLIDRPARRKVFRDLRAHANWWRASRRALPPCCRPARWRR